MKAIVFISLLFLLCGGVQAQSTVLTLRATYHGKNIYVQNPYAANMVDYCATEVFVNGAKQDINLEQSAFEIDLSYLAINDSVFIQIFHKGDCKPKVLNSAVPNVHIDFSYTHLHIIGDSCLGWGVTGKPKQKTFYVERVEYNIWKSIDTIFVDESNTDSSWTCPVDLFSAENQFRIKCVLKDGRVIYSSAYNYINTAPQIKIKNDKQNKVIQFTREGNYQLLSETGELIQEGRATSVSYGTMSKGRVHLYYDNQVATLRLK